MASGGPTPDVLAISRDMKNLVNAQDINAIMKAQQNTLQRLEKSNEMLGNCNGLSSKQLALASEKFNRHTSTLQEMKKDLQSIFSRIKTLRSKIESQHPGEFSMALENEMQNVLFGEEEIDTESKSSENELYDSSAKGHFNQKPNT